MEISCVARLTNIEANADNRRRHSRSQLVRIETHEYRSQRSRRVSSGGDGVAAEADGGLDVGERRHGRVGAAPDVAQARDRRVVRLVPLCVCVCVCVCGWVGVGVHARGFVGLVMVPAGGTSR